MAHELVSDFSSFLFLALSMWLFFAGFSCVGDVKMIQCNLEFGNAPGLRG